MINIHHHIGQGFLVTKDVRKFYPQRARGRETDFDIKTARDTQYASQISALVGLCTCVKRITKSTEIMFSDLLDETNSMVKRIDNASKSANLCESRLLAMTPEHSITVNENHSKTNINFDTEHGLFTKSTMPVGYREQFAKCEEIPDFTDFENHPLHDPEEMEKEKVQSIRQRYSDPYGIYNKWISSQERKANRFLQKKKEKKRKLYNRHHHSKNNNNNSSSKKIQKKVQKMKFNADKYKKNILGYQHKRRKNKQKKQQPEEKNNKNNDIIECIERIRGDDDDFSSPKFEEISTSADGENHDKNKNNNYNQEFLEEEEEEDIHYSEEEKEKTTSTPPPPPPTIDFEFSRSTVLSSSTSELFNDIRSKKFNLNSTKIISRKKKGRDGLLESIRMFRKDNRMLKPVEERELPSSSVELELRAPLNIAEILQRQLSKISQADFDFGGGVQDDDGDSDWDDGDSDDVSDFEW